MILTNELAQKYIDFHSNELFNEFEKQYKRVMDFENRKEKYLSKKIEKIKDVLEKAELTKHGFKFKYADGDGIMFFCGAKYSETAEYQNENGINYYNEIAYYFENHIVLGNDLPRIGETFYKPYKGDIFSIPDDYKPIPADESDIFNIFIKELTAYVVFDYYKRLLDFKKYFEPAAPVLQSESTAHTAPVAIESKIMFKDYENIYKVLQSYFDEKDKSALKSILQSGKDAETPLLFLESGNKLACAFKDLFESEYITGCKKKNLEKWILLNFRYNHNDTEKEYTADYLNRIISTSKDLCSEKNKIIFDF